MAVSPPGAATRIDRVCVSWREEWAIERYLDHYTRTRRLTARGHDRSAILECLARYPGARPYRKSDLDYFLDANLGRSRR